MTCSIVAEIGVNHNGSVAQAHHLITAAYQAGANAVKVQVFTPSALVTADAPCATYQGGGTQREMLERLVLPESAWGELRQHARELGLLFIATPFDSASVELLGRIEVDAVKIGSGDITCHPLLKQAGSLGKPVIISTGMATTDEIAAALALDCYHTVVLLHCVSAYPAPIAAANLRCMDTMRQLFQQAVGWSDHTPGYTAALAAAALGADMVEKHLTLYCAAEGPDHAASLDPFRFREMVDGIRAVESALGATWKAPQPCEDELRAVARRSLVTAHALDAGAILTPANVTWKRPGTGIPPSDLGLVLGRRLRQALPADHVISWGHLDGEA